MITGLILFKLPYRILQSLVLPFIPPNDDSTCRDPHPWFGKTVNGASRWIQLGALSFQPAELAKLAIIALIAKNLSRPSFQGLQSLYFYTYLLPALIPLCSDHHAAA